MFMREDSSGKYLQALNELQEEKSVFEVLYFIYKFIDDFGISSFSREY